MITVKPDAITHFFNQKPDNKNLYLNLKKTGCSGYSYQLEWFDKSNFDKDYKSIEIKNTDNKEISRSYREYK